jgi:hypothetical protein
MLSPDSLYTKLMGIAKKKALFINMDTISSNPKQNKPKKISNEIQ